jgi:hypothetical protein
VAVEDLDKLARRRANRKLRFYSHAGVFVIVNATLYVAGTRATSLPAWQLWTSIGWSVGLAIHGFFALLYAPIQERMIARERRLLEDRAR